MNARRRVLRVSPGALMLLLVGSTVCQAQMVLDSFTGPITQHELDAFKAFMKTRAIPPHPWGFNDTDHNYIADGPAGRDVEAMGLMYEATGDVEILNRMIDFVDAFVYMRNDLPGGTQVVMWTGNVDPVWPGNGPAVTPSNYAGGENGDTIAHIEYCAVLILKTPALWNMTVPDGNPHGFGTTYLDRAMTYVARTDEANDQYSYLYFVTADNLIRNPPNWPHGFHTMEAINIEMMLDGGFQRNAEAHEILGDDPARVVQYDAVVQTSVRECLNGMEHAYTPGDHTVYKWGYYPWSTSLNESVGHGNYDVLGVWRAWSRGAYGITIDEVTPIADALVYVICRGNNQFTGNVDGSGSLMNRIDGEWMVTADWDPAVYDLIARADVANGRYAATPSIAAAVLWMKQRLSGNGLPPGWSDTDVGAPDQPGGALERDGTYSVSAGGTDIWGTSDQFNYVYQWCNGDLTMTARVATQQAASDWAKSGVMIRETLDADSAFVYLFVSPGHGVSLQYRSSAGASAVQAADVAGPSAPYWLKLLKSGSTFIGFGSDDGTNWTRIATVNVDMGAAVTAGLAVTAHDAAALNVSTFDAVSIVIAPPPTLALTPPMGWNSWNHFHCNVSDALIRGEADAMVASGMKDAGYTYVNIDDCWEGQRDAQGAIQPDPTRFADMRALADYVHNLGLKLGIYSSPGPLTCQRRPGSLGYEAQDAQTYADWGIDYLKYDWCSGQGDQETAYWKMAEALKATGRPIVYSMSQYGQNQVWKWAAAVGANLWRVSGDISDNYDRMASIGFGQNGREIYAGHGHWNDPDMLEIGNGGMSVDEYRTHMTLWCILAAPLLAGNDLRNMSVTTIQLLTNPEVIAVDQDPAGIQGDRISQDSGLEVWAKPLADGSYAVGLFNRTLSDASITVNFADVGVSDSASVRDLWNRQDLGVYQGAFTSSVPAHGAVLIRVSNQAP